MYVCTHSAAPAHARTRAHRPAATRQSFVVSQTPHLPACPRGGTPHKPPDGRDTDRATAVNCGPGIGLGSSLGVSLGRLIVVGALWDCVHHVCGGVGLCRRMCATRVCACAVLVGGDVSRGGVN